MKKVIRLTESDLTRIVKRVLMEQEMSEEKIMSCLLKTLGESDIQLSEIPKSCMTLIQKGIEKKTPSFEDLQLGLDCGMKCAKNPKIIDLATKIPDVITCVTTSDSSEDLTNR
jgi:hypothetical protein